MKDPVFLLIYNLIYSAVAKNGRDELFGKHLEIDNDVFLKSFAGNEFPEIWFELPLSKDPWYDLHVLTSKGALEPAVGLPEGIFHPQLFHWFSKAAGVKQLALSHDFSKGVYDDPAAQLLVSVRDPSVGCSFLTEAGSLPSAQAYRAFINRIPERWFACYLGTFPKRDDMNLRVECIPDVKAQAAYSSDGYLLRRDLAKAGFIIKDEMQGFISFMAGQPVRTEFQFNVEPDGSAAPILGISLRFRIPTGKYPHLEFSEENENVVSLMKELSRAGLCDDRWRLLPGCAFANRLSSGDVSARFGGYPAFIKVRISPERPIDAKAYIVAYMV